MEAVSLEQYAPDRIPRSDSGDDGLGVARARALERGLEHGRAEPVPLGLGGDERTEELRVREAVRKLDSPEADHFALLLRDEERLLGRRRPVLELGI
jgi:hypothetical protein